MEPAPWRCPLSDLERFIEAWEFEAPRNVAVLEAIPADQAGHRPYPEGRSLAELGWHLAEIEAYMTHGLETGRYDVRVSPPGLEREPNEGLAAGYRRLHEDAIARARRLAPGDMDRNIAFFGGRETRIGGILWRALLHHQLHHRGQLTLMLRLAGTAPPPLYGPRQEETAAMQARS